MSVAAGQHVVSRLTDESISSVATVDQVAAAASLNSIATFAAVDDIVTVPTGDPVIASTAIDRRVLLDAAQEDTIVAVSSVHLNLGHVGGGEFCSLAVYDDDEIVVLIEDANPVRLISTVDRQRTRIKRG